MKKYAIFLVFIFVVVVSLCGSVAAADDTNTTPLSDSRHIFINVSNDNGIKFDMEELKADYVNVSSPLDTIAPVPSANLGSGLYNTDKNVILTAVDNQDPDTKIYYTLDDSTPTTGSTLYTGTISINTEGATILKFIAVDAVGNISDVITRTYIIDKTKPAVAANPAGGTFNDAQTITLTTTDASSTTTYYTTDGSDPQSSLTRIKYTHPITVDGSMTMRYAALDAAGNWSPVYNQTYIISKPVPNTRTGINYSTIQGAIDDAIDGDTIKVGVGTYAENITVDKRLTLLAQGLVTVTASNPNNPVFNILSAAAGSVINGFNITGAINSHGISIASFCNITGNIITGNGLDGINISAGNPNITGNTITGNGRDGISLNSGVATINFNRILNNTRYGLYMVSGGAVVAVATYNWWGSNNPTYVINTINPPANDTDIYDKHNGNPHVTYDPWVVLTVTASPNSIQGGTNSTVIADLNHDNNGNLITGGQIPDAAVVIFNSDLGTINPTSTVLTNNSANALLTTGNTSGTAHVSATVDGCTGSTQVIIDTVAPIVTANPAGGTFNTPKNVILTTTDANSTITYYTTDGSDPKTSGTRKVYSGPILVSSTTTLKYIAFDQAGNWSPNYIQTYTISNPDTTAPTASANPAGGIYKTNQTVSLSVTDDRDSNPKIYYTKDGTTLTTNGTLYNGPISLSNGTTTIKFIAVDASNNLSSVFVETYIIDTIAPNVTANPVGGTFNNPQNVTLSSTDSTALIYYTTDGSDPKTSNTRTPYTSPIQINETITVRCIAVDPAGNWSPPYSQTYTINKLLTVVSADPASNATDVSITSAIVIKFNKNIVAGSNYSGIYVKNLSSGNTVLMTKTISGDTLIIAQTNPRYANTWYQVYLPIGAIKDTDGKELASAFTYQFQTDKTPPIIINTSPANMSMGVSLTAPIAITLSENIVAGVNYSGICVKNLSTGNTVGITKSISGNVLTISQTLNRINNNQYMVYIPAGAVKDVAGNNLDTSYSYQFQTGAGTVDKTPPTVTSTNPAGNATGASLTAPITITLSENVIAGANYSGIYVKNLSTGNTIGITKAISGNMLTISQTLNRINNNQYMVYIPAGAIKDAAGTNLSAAYSYQFQTGTTTADKTPPTVNSTSPGGNATGVSLISSITITFSENVVAGANYSGIYVKNLSTGKIVGITNSISGKTLTINQTSSRLHNNQYAVYMPAGAVKDTTGNNLAAVYTFQFKTS